MKPVLTTLFFVAFSGVQAQLINGSFEQGLTGWEWTCNTPVLASGGAPGGGNWHAGKETGQTQSCFPSYLFQRLSGVQHGDLLTISGWLRAANDFTMAYPQLGLGTINGGVFHLEETAGTVSFVWTYVSITDTVELQEGDTAIIVLNSGLVGGPIAPALGLFDALSISTPTGMGDAGHLPVHTYFDAATDRLHCATTDGPILEAVVVDVRGRSFRHVRPIEAANLVVDLGGLPAGAYIALLRTVRGTHAVRFVAD